ncbi:unnamed protein product [Diamesa hyperborea]
MLNKVVVIVIFVTFITMSSGQRGSYSGSRPISTGGTVPVNSANNGNGLSNRFGGENNAINGNFVSNTQLNNLTPISSQPAQTNLHIPVDARGDGQLVNTISQWPVQHQPFWYINAAAIEAHRNQPQLQGNAFANRGSFMGGRQRR